MWLEVQLIFSHFFNWKPVGFRLELHWASVIPTENQLVSSCEKHSWIQLWNTQLESNWKYTVKFTVVKYAVGIQLETHCEIRSCEFARRNQLETNWKLTGLQLDSNWFPTVKNAVGKVAEKQLFSNWTSNCVFFSGESRICSFCHIFWFNYTRDSNLLSNDRGCQALHFIFLRPSPQESKS